VKIIKENNINKKNIMDSSNYKYTASICCIYKNETLHIAEWIEYHLLIGFEHFYLYNNRSNDNLPVKYKDGRESDKTFREALIEHYINAGIVTHHEYDINLADENFALMQIVPSHPFNQCAGSYKHESKWIAFIDMDEFITIRDKNQNIIEILNERFGHSDGIYMNSIVFGSSGHYFEPSGLVTDNYRLHRGELEAYIKAMYKPINIIGYYGPHSIYHTKGSIAVDGAARIIDPQPIVSGTVDPILVIHHYLSKSLWYWLKVKLNRVYDLKSLLDMERPNEWREKVEIKAEEIKYEYSASGTLRGNYIKNDHNTWDRYNDFNENAIYSDFMDKYVELLSKAINKLPFYNVYTEDIDCRAVNPIDSSDKLCCWIDPQKYSSESDSILSFIEKSKLPYTISSIMRHYFLFDSDTDKPISKWIIHVENSWFSKIYDDAILSNESKLLFCDSRSEYGHTTEEIHDIVIRFFCHIIFGNLPNKFDWKYYLETHPHLLNSGINTGYLIR
jgi:hypothetical protein